jgi:hypothetical protein
LTIWKEERAKKVTEKLSSVGYRPLPRPLQIGRVSFDDLSALTAGPGFLDLILILLVEPSVEGLSSAKWQVQRVARALDSAESLRPLTAVIITEKAPPGSIVDEILKVARVLIITEKDLIEKQIAPLLPLDVSESDNTELDTMTRISSWSRSKQDRDQLGTLVARAMEGPHEVRSALTNWLDASFERGDNDAQ